MYCLWRQDNMLYHGAMIYTVQQSWLTDFGLAVPLCCFAAAFDNERL